MPSSRTFLPRVIAALLPASVPAPANLVWWRKPLAALRSLGTAHLPEVLEPAGGLGIDDLPNGVGSLPCGSPVALISGDTGGYLTWMPALLVDAVAVGPVFLLAGHRKWVGALLAHPVLHKAYQSGNLQIWMMGTNIAQETLDHGLAPVFKDLAQAGLTANQAVFFIPANSIFSGKNMYQLHRISEDLNNWARNRQRPVVLCFAPTREGDGVPSMVRSMRNVFLHVASVGVKMAHPVLYLERWDSTDGAVFDERYGLVPKEDGLRLGYNGSLTRGAVPELAQAPDQFDVFTTRSVVKGKKGVPSHWKIVETDEEILAATKDSIAATIIIDAGWSEDFEVKARLIHQLRINRPLTLRILLREVQGKLRTHCEQALLGVGANAVLYKEMGFSRLLQFLQDSGRQAYAGGIHADYEQALGGFMPVEARGYQNPRKFCELVRLMQTRTRGIGVSHCLVHSQVLARVPHLDAIRASKISRDGDLITADQNSLYIFLFACREPDLEDTLGRLFTLPVSQLFADQASDCTEEGIDLILSRLDTLARRGLPDYSVFLQATDPAALPSSVATPSPPTTGPPALQVAQAAQGSQGATGATGATTAPSDTPNPRAPPEFLSIHRKAIGRRAAIPFSEQEPQRSHPSHL